VTGLATQNSFVAMIWNTLTCKIRFVARPLYAAFRAQLEVRHFGSCRTSPTMCPHKPMTGRLSSLVHGARALRTSRSGGYDRTRTTVAQVIATTAMITAVVPIARMRSSPRAMTPSGTASTAAK
jgi:hypothetical protein